MPITNFDARQVFWLSLCHLKVFVHFHYLGNPRSLLTSVWLSNTMHFGLRSQHEHVQMLWGDIQLLQDATGREYIEYNERATKTRDGTTGSTRPFAPKAFASQTQCKYTLCEERGVKLHFHNMISLLACKK